MKYPNPKEDTQPHLFQINVNPEGGVPKRPVPSTRLCVGGVSGDKQNDLRHHGGPSRAVCLFSFELIEALQQEGHPIEPGSTGENLTLSGLRWELLSAGDRLIIGDAILELTSLTPPCHLIKKSFLEGHLERISQKTFPGWSRWYASVAKEGLVHTGDSVTLESKAPSSGDSPF